MGNPQKVKVYKYKNIAAALAIVLLITVGISTRGNTVEKDKTKKPDTTSSVSANDKKKKNTSSQADEPFKADKLTKNYKYESIKNGTSLNNGNLVLINSEHPFTGEITDTDGVYSYLFDKSGEQIMYATSTLINGDIEMLDKFNEMGCDFSKETGLKTLMVTALLSEGEDASDTDENACGRAVDLALYDAVNGTYPEFTGEGDYAWLSQNCWKYGFIYRYPAEKSDVTGVSGKVNHFRYVGVPYAEIMHNSGETLEEFLETIKKYSFESPMSFESESGTGYAVYYVRGDIDHTTTNIPVPLKEDNSEYYYSVSGNNYDGYVVYVNLTDEITVQPETADDTSVADESSSVASAENYY